MQNNAFKKVFTRIVYFVFFVNILLVIAGLIFIQLNPYFVDKVYKKVYKKLEHYGVLNIKHIPEILTYKFQSLYHTPETIYLDIKHINMQKIEFMRQNALNGAKNFKYVPAVIRYKNDKFKIKLRLKGDRKVHFNDLDNASYRIKVKGDNTLFGMKVFSIQKPRVRNYIEEWIFLQMMRDEGIVAPRYKFVNMAINGKKHSVYAIEEHYTKYLIENNKRKDGPIIKFSEDENTTNFKAETVEVFNFKNWKKKSRMPMVQKSVSLLDGFKKGTLAIKDVFDEKKLARFFAIADLNFAWHGVVTKSMRFYYNPVTSRLEPVPFDGHRGTANTYLMSSELGIISKDNWTHQRGYGGWFKKFFNDQDSYSKEFYEEYIKTLERVSKKKYLDVFFAKHNAEISNILKLIYSELPMKDNIFFYSFFPYYFDKNSYYKTQRYIDRKLKKHLIVANINKIDQRLITLSITNKHTSLAYEIISLSNKNNTINCKPTSPHILMAESNFSLALRQRRSILFKCDNAIQYDNTLALELRVKHPGSEEIFIVDVSPWHIESAKTIQSDITRRKSNIEKFKFIRIDEKNKEIKIKTGSYTIDKDLIIPKGYTFIIEQGTTLHLVNNPIILSYSKYKWIGTKENKILITSDSGNNGSLVVLNANGISELNYVNFENLSYPKVKDWMISGSVNFYKSDSILSNIVISSNDAEDAINSISSNFDLNNIQFNNIKSDALDIDFGTGKIKNSNFNQVGNDAIDISGTTINLDNIHISNIGDKAISAGEVSSISGSNIDIRGAEIAIASKDGSSVTLNKVTIQNTKLGLTAFQKKSEYSQASININNLTTTNVKRMHAIEISSTININGSDLIGKVKNVNKILYGNTYGKKTKKLIP